MPKYLIESLDSVDEALRGFYKQREDGKYQLQLEDVSVDGLIGKRDELLNELKQTKSQLKAIEANTQDAEKKRLEEAQQFEQLYRSAEAEKARFAAELQALNERVIGEKRTSEALKFASLVTSNPKQQQLLVRELIDHIKPAETGELSVEGLLAGDLETVKSRIKTEYPFLADAVVSTGGGAIGGATVPQQAQGNQAAEAAKTKGDLHGFLAASLNPITQGI